MSPSLACSNVEPSIEAERLFKEGLTFDRRGDYPQAIAHYHRAIALCPFYVEAYNNLGCVLVKDDQLEPAIDAFQQGIALDPHRAELHNNIAQAYVMLEQPDQAIAAYQRAIQCQPDMAMAYHNLGRLWHDQHHYDRAIAWFQIALQHTSGYHTPEAVTLYNDCAQAFLDWGKPTQALPYLRRAIASQPQFIEGYCEMVESQPVRDALDRARHHCATFLRSLRDNASASDCLVPWANTYRAFGDVSFLYERYDQAGQYYERSLQLQPHQVDLWERLADCFARMGHAISAVLYYQQALQAQPSGNAAAIYLKLACLLETHFPEAAAHYYHQVCRQMAVARPRPTLTPRPAPRSHPAHPNRVYVTTADWVADTTVDAVNYVPVAWGTASPVQSPITAPIPVLSTGSAFRPQCGGVSCGSCMKQLCSQFQPQWVEDGVSQCVGRSHPAPSFPQVTDPPAFVVTIPRGRAWIVPQRNSWMICNAIAIITPDGALLGDLSRCYPWYLPGCSKHDFGNHRLFSQRDLPPVVQLKGTVAVLSCLAGHVYYHWMFDLLPRLEILRRSGIPVEDIDWFVVNNTNKPFQRETLAQLGIPPEKVIASDVYSHIQADELIVPSYPGFMDWVPLATITWLRTHFLTPEFLTQKRVTPECVTSRYVTSEYITSRYVTPECATSECVTSEHTTSTLLTPEQGDGMPKPGKQMVSPPVNDRITHSGGKRLYLSRANASYRRVINEKDLCDRLDSFGFITIYPETLSVQEQAELFAQADIIVAPHGSGLANLAFCTPGTRVIELFAPDYVRTDYWIISQRLQLEHYFVIGEPFDCELLRRLMDPNPLTENIYVISEATEGILKVLHL